jgi:hypothetical protein
LGSSDADSHQGLKRWERTAHKKFWKQRGEEAEAPSLPCWWHPGTQDAPRLRLAVLLALFESDLALVRFAPASKDPTLTEPNQGMGIRLLRAGIPWELWHPWLLRAYLRGARVPAPFVPLRRLPPSWINEALQWPAILQARFFVKLRETGLLKGLSKLDAAGISTWMRWEEVRGSFLDFKETAPEKL